MKRFLPLIPILAAMAGCSAEKSADSRPAWLEPDSAAAIADRIASDFSLPYADGEQQIIEQYPGMTAADVRLAADSGYIETRIIDGAEMMHRKAVRNFGLLSPAHRIDWTCRGSQASEARLSYAQAVASAKDGKLKRRYKVRFSIDVPYHPELQGDTLRAWLPFPMETDRQTNVQLLSTSQSDYTLSPEGSEHSTLFFSAPVDTAGNKFEYVAEFTAVASYFAPEKILAEMKPYNVDSDLYKQYTATGEQHIIRLDSLAHAIVGTETNPFKQSELVYNYIVHNYPWAGALEYSTIPCIPQYVVESRHGDCGQVSLLYISLMRTLGVPARWESGWMLHPGEKNLHDWAEVYYEGIGWVPVDASFGRYTASSNPAVRNFYSSGIDDYRLVANKGVGKPFHPAKKYVRSETVDSQLGEVECSAGNLFYPAWDQTLEILSSNPID